VREKEMRARTRVLRACVQPAQSAYAKGGLRVAQAAGARSGTCVGAQRGAATCSRSAPFLGGVQAAR